VFKAYSDSGGRPAQEYVASANRSSAVWQCFVLHFGNGADELVGEAAPDYAAICATSRAGPSRSNRAVNDCRSVGGIA